MTRTIRYAWGDSTLGSIIVASSDRGLVAMEFRPRHRAVVDALRRRFAHDELVEDPESLAETLGAVAHMIEQPAVASSLTLDPHGSELELRVWSALREIPAGETVSYGVLAARLGMPNGAREVGAACAANALAVLIPQGERI
jgi:AraC family transcriptional regulator of adaptative response/methylated-DNA-[protein]-cysteine methyltransferase